MAKELRAWRGCRDRLGQDPGKAVKRSASPWSGSCTIIHQPRWDKELPGALKESPCGMVMCKEEGSVGGGGQTSFFLFLHLLHVYIPMPSMGPGTETVLSTIYLMNLNEGGTG